MVLLYFDPFYISSSTLSFFFLRPLCNLILCKPALWNWYDASSSSHKSLLLVNNWTVRIFSTCTASLLYHRSLSSMNCVLCLCCCLFDLSLTLLCKKPVFVYIRSVTFSVQVRTAVLLVALVTYKVLCGYSRNIYM